MDQENIPFEMTDAELEREAAEQQIPEVDRPAWKARQREIDSRNRSHNNRGGIGQPDGSEFRDDTA